MTQITRFAGQDSGPSARVRRLVAHLRDHGFSLDVYETQTAVQSPVHIRASGIDQTYLAPNLPVLPLKMRFNDLKTYLLHTGATRAYSFENAK